MTPTHASKLALSAAVAATAAAFIIGGGTTVASAAPASTAHTHCAHGTSRLDAGTEQRNRAAIRSLYSAAFERPTSTAARAAVRHIVAANAADHSGTATGPGAILAGFSATQQRVPGAHAVIKHIAADGDLVAVHYEATATPANDFTGEAHVDLYRLAHGQVVETWSLSQTVPATTASGNSMFSNLAPTTTHLSEQQEEQQRQFGVATYNTLFDTQDATVLDRAFSSTYLQHNTGVPNGTALLKQVISSGAVAKSKVDLSLSDGDLVWTFSKPLGATASTPFQAADIFRVARGADGKRVIVEHWDVVPPAATK